MSLTLPKKLSAVSLTPAINFRLFGYLWSVSMTPGKMLSPVLLSLAIIAYRCRWYRRKIYHWCLCHWRSLFTGVIDTTEQFIAGVVDTADKKFIRDYLGEFLKKVGKKWNTQGPGWHWFMRKNWSRKSRVRLPLTSLGGAAMLRWTGGGGGAAPHFACYNEPKKTYARRARAPATQKKKY